MKSFVISLFVVSAREAELRRLRKANIEFEEQNAALQRHIKDMYNAKERLEAELGQDEKRTQALQQHLLAIKHTLVNSLSSVPLPGQQSVGCIQSERRETDINRASWFRCISWCQIIWGSFCLFS